MLATSEFESGVKGTPRDQTHTTVRAGSVLLVIEKWGLDGIVGYPRVFVL